MTSEGLSIRNDYGYEIIGRLRDRILLFRDQFNAFEVQAYDAQMRESWSRKLEDIDKRGTQIIGVVGGKNDFSVIFKVRRKGRTALRIHKYDPGANLIDSMLVKDYGERVFSPPVLDYVKSEDRNTIAVYNDTNEHKMEVTCIRLDKMQVIWDKAIDVPNASNAEDDDHLVLGNKGDFYYISEYDNRKSRWETHRLEVLHLTPDAHEQLVTVSLNHYLTCSVEFDFDNTNQQLVGAGTYGEKGRDRSMGSFYVRLPTQSNTALVAKEAFDDKFVSILRQKDVEEDNRGISDCQVRQLILRRDGGVVMLAERSYELQRGASAGRGIWRDGARLVIDFYYEDIFAVAVAPTGKVQWKTVLHKKQYSQDDDGTFSSYFLFRNPDQLHFLFNDEIKYENTCSEYLVSPLGEFDRNSLLSTENQALRLRFKDAVQISATECIVPSEFRNKLKLALIQY